VGTGLFAMKLWSFGGTGNHGVDSRRERGSRETRERVRVCWCCSAQWCTVALLSDAGQPFGAMAARNF